MILLIYGAHGLAKEIYDLVLRSIPGKYEKIYFIDDYVKEDSCYLSESIHFNSIGSRFERNMNEVEGIVGVGEPIYREILAKKFDSVGIKLATLIDSTAIVSPSARIGEGTVICEYSTIHADVHIGRGCIVQSFCDIGHDIVLGDYSVMSSTSAPGGKSVFGKRVYMGMNACTKEKITIGDDVIIAMGSAVFRDVASGMTVIGNPARETRGNDAHRVF